MHNLGTAERVDALALLAVENEELANQSPARLLITAPTQQGVENLARRIHGAGHRAQFPFVQTWAVELPVGPELLKEYCGRFLDSAAGGSLLVSAVEEMPAIVQDAMIELLSRLESARMPSGAARHARKICRWDGSTRAPAGDSSRTPWRTSCWRSASCSG